MRGNSFLRLVGDTYYLVARPEPIVMTDECPEEVEFKNDNSVGARAAVVIDLDLDNNVCDAFSPDASRVAHTCAISDIRNFSVLILYKYTFESQDYKLLFHICSLLRLMITHFLNFLERKCTRESQAIIRVRVTSFHMK